MRFCAVHNVEVYNERGITASDPPKTNQMDAYTQQGTPNSGGKGQREGQSDDEGCRDMDVFDRQLGAEVRRIGSVSAGVMLPTPSCRRSGVAMKQPSATAGLRYTSSNARPVITPGGGGSNGNTPAGAFGGTPTLAAQANLSSSLRNSPAGLNSAYSNTATPNGLPSGSTRQNTPPPPGVDPDQIAAFLSPNRNLPRQVKLDIARLVIKQSGLTFPGPLTDETATRIVSILAAELSPQANTRWSSRISSLSSPLAAFAFPSSPSEKWSGNPPPATVAGSTVAEELVEGRAACDFEAEVLYSCRGSDKGYSSAREEDLQTAGTSRGADLKATSSDCLASAEVNFVPLPSTAGFCSPTPAVLTGGGSTCITKPRPTIKPNVRLNPNIPLMAAFKHLIKRPQYGSSPVTRSASSAFSECSTSSRSSIAGNVGQN